MLAVFERLAFEAGEEIIDVRNRQFVIAEKADGSPVTDADRRAEKVIVAGLLKDYPRVPVVAEELVSIGDVPASLGQQFFLVDALDGTREFCSGRDEFTVNIALVENAVPVVGVVYSPAMRVLYAAEHDGRGSGTAARASVSDIGNLTGRRQISTRQPSQPLTIVATRSHMTSETKAYLDRFPEADCRAIGSSLKFCLLAEGEADLYPRFGTTMEWDTAAGDAILRAAGGQTRTLDGEPLAYGKRAQPDMRDFQNPFFVSKG